MNDSHRRHIVACAWTAWRRWRAETFRRPYRIALWKKLFQLTRQSSESTFGSPNKLQGSGSFVGSMTRLPKSGDSISTFLYVFPGDFSVAIVSSQIVLDYLSVGVLHARLIVVSLFLTSSWR